MSRRGAGLLELVVALTLTALVAALAGGLLSSAVLRLRDRTERISGENSLSVGAAAIRAGLESLGHDSLTGADFLAAAPSALVARATRAAGVLCAANPGLLVVRVGPEWWSALRDPVAGRDSLLVGTLDQPAWRLLALEASAHANPCPDGSPGLGLPVVSDSLSLAGIGVGSPLRVVENVELRLYRSAPDDWLGLRLLSTAQAIQPFAGPMASAGLLLDFVGRDGLPTSRPAEIAGVTVRLTSLTEAAGGLGLARGHAPRPDSLAVFVGLWNLP